MIAGDYLKDIEKLFPSLFTNIYVIDMVSDLVFEYGLKDNTFCCLEESPFTRFCSNLENVIHSDDIAGYVDSISANNLQTKLKSDDDFFKYQYRRLNDHGSYDWYLNIVKLLKVDQKNLVIVLVTSINNSIADSQSDTVTIENLETKQKIVFDAISNSIINLKRIMDINATTNNPEMRSIINYVDNVLNELTNTFPELNDALASNLINNVNQGKTKTIIVVDDDQVTRNLLSKTFADLYKIVFAVNGREAIDILEKNNDVNTLDTKDKIVGMFLDLNMPEVDGFGVLDYMSSRNLLAKMPVIIISGDYDQSIKERLYTYPIADVLEKPFNIQVIKHRIRNFIKLYKANNSLTEIVFTQHQEIKNVLKTMVKSYLYDNYNDLKKMSDLITSVIDQVVSDYHEYNFDKANIEKIAEAIKYYDIGLYTLPRHLISKEEYNDDELKILKSSPFIGISIFDSVLYRNTDRLFNHYAKDIIQFSKENYDGSGYPQGLKEEQIPIVAQIASIVIDYVKALHDCDADMALSKIVERAGTKYNPKFVDSFKEVIRK